jgi:hypothetical protein
MSTTYVAIGKFVEAAGGCAQGTGSDFVKRGKFPAHFNSRFKTAVKEHPAPGAHIKRVPYGRAHLDEGPWAMRLAKLKALYGPP